MTRRAKALDEIAPEALLEMTPEDMQALGVADGEFVRVVSRRGEITVKAVELAQAVARASFSPSREAAANLLTIDALDPYGKIPEFKFCARVRRRSVGERSNSYHLLTVIPDQRLPESRAPGPGGFCGKIDLHHDHAGGEDLLTVAGLDHTVVQMQAGASKSSRGHGNP